MSAGSFWFKTLAGSESGITRYWLHKRLRELYGLDFEITHSERGCLCNYFNPSLSREQI